MTLYEIYIQSNIKPSERLSEVEWYVSKVLTKQELIEREKMVKRNKPKQLTLEL